MIRVLGVSLFGQNIPSAVYLIHQEMTKGQKQNLLISATGAHGLVTAQRDPKFMLILNSFYLNLPDGMPAVWVGRLKGAREMQRCYGPDFFQAVMIATRDQPVRHFLCGGKEGVAEELQQVCAERFGNPNIVGFESPPFRELTEGEMAELGSRIAGLDVDIVWIGMSTPKQERFAYRLAQHTRVHFICTVGAAFDFHTGRVRQAPRWMQRSGLEWFFRLLTEPKRLWRRYATVVPLFIYYNLKELVQEKFWLQS